MAKPSTKLTSIDNPEAINPAASEPAVKGPVVAPAEAPDPFDLARLRIPAEYEQGAAVKRLLTTVPVRKPHRQEWVWVHPSELYRETLMCLQLKEENETYLVLPHIAVELPGEIKRYTLYTAQNAAGVISLWPVKVAEPGERLDSWSISAHEAAARAMHERIRLAANRSLGAYETFVTNNPSEPKPWPDLPYRELLRLAFNGGRLVDDFDHPAIRELRGL